MSSSPTSPISRDQYDIYIDKIEKEPISIEAKVGKCITFTASYLASYGYDPKTLGRKIAEIFLILENTLTKDTTTIDSTSLNLKAKYQGHVLSHIDCHFCSKSLNGPSVFVIGNEKGSVELSSDIVHYMTEHAFFGLSKSRRRDPVLVADIISSINFPTNSKTLSNVSLDTSDQG